MNIEEARSIVSYPVGRAPLEIVEATNLVNSHNHPNLGKQGKLFPTLLPEKTLNWDKLKVDPWSLPATAEQVRSIVKLAWATKTDVNEYGLNRREARDLQKRLLDKLNAKKRKKNK